MKDIKFARKYLKAHPKHGQETFFIEKIWSNDDALSPPYIKPVSTSILEKEFDNYTKNTYHPKGHTIRKGNRWKEGDLFDATVWTADPYHSKVITFAKDIKVVKTHSFEIKDNFIYVDKEKIGGMNKMEDKVFGDYYYLYGFSNIELIAKNDGLELQDFLDWFKFPEPFDGQIIVWREDIDYSNSFI